MQEWTINTNSMAGLQTMPLFSSDGESQTFFPRAGTNLHSHQHLRVPPYPHQPLILLVVLAILVDVSWYLPGIWTSIYTPGYSGWSAFHQLIGHFVWWPMLWRSCSNSLPVFHCIAFLLLDFGRRYILYKRHIFCGMYVLSRYRSSVLRFTCSRSKCVFCWTEVTIIYLFVCLFLYLFISN